MQPPTLTGVRLRTIHDALVIFHAVACGLLPSISRRLDFEERKQIKSGNIYVWEERNPSTNAVGLGIERWTDGRQYTPSRVREEFLLYVAKDLEPSSAGLQPMGAAEAEAHRLIKQTYSVYLADSYPRRKWHITAYYTPATLRSLVTVDDLPVLLSIDVPDGAYIPARTSKHPRSRTSDDYYPAYPTPSQASTSIPGTSSLSRRRGSGASDSSYEGTNPIYAPYRPRSNSRSSSSPAPYQTVPFPSHPAHRPSLTNPTVGYTPPPSSYHDPDQRQSIPPRNYSVTQRPSSMRPLDIGESQSTLALSQDESDGTAEDTVPGVVASSSLPVNMVPLPQLEQSQGRTGYYRDPLDDYMLRSFPPSGR